jgi:hypothetical protein
MVPTADDPGESLQSTGPELNNPSVPRRQHVLVVDVRLPFRHRKFLEERPFEADFVVTWFEELRKDRRTQVDWRRLVQDHGFDSVWFQIYRQDPRHPFDHEKPYFLRRVDALLEHQPPGPPPKEPEQRTGESGLAVATLYFPKGESPRSEEELARQTVDVLERFEREARFT